ncbi:branched-chain-amino-acid aminotransferase [Geranomyces michiganensis]|nr:branched-chain-amino-acid aminotransferase [Geranomyces michiganensis]
MLRVATARSLSASLAAARAPTIGSAAFLTTSSRLLHLSALASPAPPPAARHHHRNHRQLSTAATAAPLRASALTKTLTKSPKSRPPNDKLQFGHTFSDHMLTVEWDAAKGWHAPEIKPYGNLSLDPAAKVFHYGLECFEGMKAYKDAQGKIRLFRPDMNMARLNKSCARLTLPTFDGAELLKCIKEFLRVDQKWIPSEHGYSLYLRPTAIATEESLGVGESNRALLFVIASPVGPYYKTGLKAVSLSATRDYVRAWPGGTGDAKIGGNYAPGIRPQIEVAERGHQQNLWLFGDEGFVTEVGTMNFFLFWTNPQGTRELITPPLDGTILPGVTRDSILSLTRSWGEFTVSERPITMREIAKACDEGRVHEAFGAGTAAIVSPIRNVFFEGRDVAIPLDPSDKTKQGGPLATRLKKVIEGIQYGEVESEWSVVVD